jgi:hypothetical protein
MPKKIKAKELLGLVNVVDMGFVEGKREQILGVKIPQHLQSNLP